MNLEEQQSFSILSFLDANTIVNENTNRIEFIKHFFMIDPYNDDTPRQVIMKASQVGWSTLAIIKALWLAKYKKANIIYTMPSRNSVKDFVAPKVDPIIESNPIFKSWMGNTDNYQLKRVGDRFIYFRGSWDPSTAISISSHILINDEVDRSNQKTLRTFKTRLDAAKMDRPDLGYEWEFSNPSIPGFGVHERYEKSDQKVWKIKCEHCNRWQTLTYPDNLDFDNKRYICKHCKLHLTDENRRVGVWVAKYPDREISGYWISQLMVPWIPASKIIEESEGDQQVFYNFTLGLPYITQDQKITRQSIVQCISPDENPMVGNAMGVDVGVIKHYVIGNKYGVFKMGTTKSWAEIEDLRNRYAATMVIDANPYPKVPAELAIKYAGKSFIHYYRTDNKSTDIVRWLDGDRRGVVESDRTKIFDRVVSDINAKDITFNLTTTDMEEFITHAEAMYRAVVTNSKGIPKAEWLTIEGKPDHFLHAFVYQQIALEKTLVDSAIIKSSPTRQTDVYAPVISADQTVPALNLQEIARQSAQSVKSGGWETR